MSRLNGFKPDWAERIQRGRTKAFGKGYAKGFEDGSKEMNRFLRDLLVASINNDAVLRMTADVRTLERVVEIIEEQ
jgi:flagellar biosynthesis/type III secretory pathway protein FliH